MVKQRSPGPRYALPTMFGNVKHDPTRPQAPAFSFGVVTQRRAKISSPGPKYDTRDINQHGKIRIPQAPVLGRWRATKIPRTPAPKQYSTKLIDHQYPSYSFGFKRQPSGKSKTPGPNKYAAPSCMGPKIPDRTAQPAYSILSRNVVKPTLKAPGPKYMLPAPNVYLKNPPRVALLGKRKVKHSTAVPGPNKYNPKPTYEKREALKGITFGVQHSPEQYIVYFPEDREVDAFVF
ncbi:Outer dense fiber protein 3-like protein 2 [Homalodisca vitripennis]|nr:Outer dense fiber protein 3-like protein 2 [Homalodisca vitripennis]